MKLKDLRSNPQNPRYLTEADFQKLLNKLLTFPRLLEKNKITFDSEQGNTILGGNMRFKALNYICDTYTRESIFDAIKTAQNNLNVDSKELLEESVTVFTRMIEKRSLPENWVQDAKGLSEEEKQAFVVIDNVSDGKWDFDVLANNWSDVELGDWGVDVWQPEELSDDDLDEAETEIKDYSDDLKDTYEVIITCQNEIEQESVFNKLKKEGYLCRVLTL